jgi:O-antigen/teichoic acid export membrane protein
MTTHASRSRIAILGIPILALSYGLWAIAFFVVNLTLGRKLGAATLGVYAIANSSARIFFAATDLGLTSHLTRALARDRGDGQRLTSLIASFRLALFPAAALFAAVVALVRGAPIATYILIVVAQGLLTLHSLYESVVQAYERPLAAGVLHLSAAAFVICGCLIAIGWSEGLQTFMVINLASLAGGLIVWRGWTQRHLRIAPSWSLERHALSREVRQAWPIGLSFVLSNLALRTPIFVLATFGRDADVGAFAAVDMFIGAATIVQAAITNATYPKLSAAFGKEPSTFRRLFLRSNASLCLLGLLIATVLAFGGHTVVRLLLPDKDFEAIDVLMPIAAWSTPILLLVHHNILLFAAANRERLNIAFMAAWWASIAFAQFLLVPTFGLVGAAWALLLGRTLGLVVLVFVVIITGLHRGQISGRSQ